MLKSLVLVEEDQDNGRFHIVQRKLQIVASVFQINKKNQHLFPLHGHILIQIVQHTELL